MTATSFRELLERAFAAARDSGKPDWSRMLVAVLRNRLLQLTDQRFSPQDMGASSLIELVSRHDDLVAIDRTVKPVMLTWLGPVPEPGRRVLRVRADLWRAIMDLTSGQQYEWDPEVGRACPCQKADPARRLPTVDAATLAAWRHAFVEATEPTLADPRARDQLRRWVTATAGRRGLSGALSASWSDHLKRQVVARLTRWFEESGRRAPDLFEAASDEPERTGNAGAVGPVP